MMRLFIRKVIMRIIMDVNVGKAVFAFLAVIPDYMGFPDLWNLALVSK